MSTLSELVDSYPNSLDGFDVAATSYYSRLFRQILLDTHMSPIKWRLLQRQYIADPSNKVLVGVHSAERAALTKLRRRLANPNMGRKSFMVALKFLNPVESGAIQNALILTWPDGRKTTHIVNRD